MVIYVYFGIQNQYLIWSVILKFPSNASETAEFWCIVSLTVILHLLRLRKNATLLWSVVFIIA